MTSQILVQTALRSRIASLDAKRKNKKNKKKKLGRANTCELFCCGSSSSTKKNFVTAPDLLDHSRVLALTYDALPCAEGCYEDHPEGSRIHGIRGFYERAAALYRHARRGAVKATVLAGDAGPTLAD